MKKGLIAVRGEYLKSAEANPDEFIFDSENGDDWFYTEDNSGKDGSAPVTIATMSGGGKEVIRLRYPSQPTHTVLHEGACKFTGLEDVPDTDAPARLTIQEL